MDVDKIYKTCKEYGITDLESYLSMMNFCDTICNLGLAPSGYSSLPFRDANLNNHYAGACFKFYKEDFSTFFGDPYITVSKNK